MVGNSCLQNLEGRRRLKRMWKLVAQAGKKEEQMSGGEQLSWMKSQGLIKKAKFLGVYINSKFSWKFHISEVEKKLQKNIVSIFRLEY